MYWTARSSESYLLRKLVLKNGRYGWLFSGRGFLETGLFGQLNSLETLTKSYFFGNMRSELPVDFQKR